MTRFEPNPEQARVIRHVEGAVLLAAPVGTGKTQTLAYRAAAAARNGFAPGRILCLTFTNRAAAQMRARLHEEVPDMAREVTLMTFHGLCAHILRLEARHLGIPPDFVIYDEVDSTELLIEAGADPRTAKDLYHTLSARKAALEPDTFRAGGDTSALSASVDPLSRAAVQRYQELLLERHALDFGDLVLDVRAALHQQEDLRRRWMERYDFVQVDEVQDTHASEYDVVQFLARRHGNLALIGDLAQTIYEWRGSEPNRLLRRFKEEFDPAVYHLSDNYRSTKILLEAAAGILGGRRGRYALSRPGPGCAKGTRILLHGAATEETEGDWIARQIRADADDDPGFAYSRGAVLVRTNRRAHVISERLRTAGIPHVTVEQFEFFRRQEIKDAMARLRLLVNPRDAGSLHRTLLRPPSGIGSAVINRLIREGASCALRLSDLAAVETLRQGDPFLPLLDAHFGGAVVVFDVESTGLVPDRDEIVEIAAVRIEPGAEPAAFHAFVRNAVPVGDSESIHGWSDAFLAEHGRNPGEILAAFATFCEGAVLAGHNVGYDRAIWRSQAERAGLIAPELPCFDTWDIALRCLDDLPDYRLDTLAQCLNLTTKPTHRAQDDVAATAELLQHLLPMLQQGADHRQKLIASAADSFRTLAQDLDRWRSAMVSSRPGDLLAQVLEESGLRALYAAKGETRRLRYLDELLTLFHARDQTDLPPAAALRRLLEFTSLARNVDHLSEQDNRLPVITIHQAKGLEFDTIYIAGATDSELPSYFAAKENRVEEERRLFYVALTRARSHARICWHNVNQRGYATQPSRFIQSLPTSCTTMT